jgi:hypothetical protein
MLYSFLFPATTHNTDWIILNVKVSPLQHILGVETIHKNQPGEELDTWSTSRFPDDFENRMSLHVLEYFRIESP